MVFGFHSLKFPYRQYVNVKWTIDNKEVVIQFRVMIYGLSPATSVCTIVTRVIMDVLNYRYLTRMVLHIYIDDVIVILSGRKSSCLRKFNKIIKLFKSLGLLMCDDKIKPPSKVQLVLGKVVDTRSLLIHVNSLKDNELLYLLSVFKGEVRLRMIASIIGKCMALDEALKIPAILYFPTLISVLNNNISEEDPSTWDNYFPVSDQMREEFAMFLREYPYLSGKWVHQPPSGKYLTSDMVKDIIKEDVQITSGDSSDHCSVVLDFKSKEYVVKRFSLSQSQQSSSYRELLALQSLSESDLIKPNSVIFFLSDSQVLGNNIISLNIFDLITLLFQSFGPIKARQEKTLPPSFSTSTSTLQRSIPSSKWSGGRGPATLSRSATPDKGSPPRITD